MPPRPEDRKVSDEVRRSILKHCESFPNLAKPHLMPNKHRAEMLALCGLVNREFPIDQHVDYGMTSEVISRAKSTFTRKIKALILDHRVKESEVDSRMGSWEFYLDFKYYRKYYAAIEKSLWEQAAGNATMGMDGSGSTAGPSTSSASASTAPTSATTSGPTPPASNPPPKPSKGEMSDDVMRAILKACESFPALSEKTLKPSRHQEEFKELCQLVNAKFPENQHIDAKTAAKTISSAKTVFARKLEHLILQHRITENQVDERMGTWKFYSDFKYYRQYFKASETKLWVKQAAEDAYSSMYGTDPSSPNGSSTSAASAPAPSTPAPTASSTAQPPSTTTPSHGSSRIPKFEIQKLHMALVKKGPTTGGLRSGNVAYARNSRSALRNYQKKFLNSAKLSTTKLSAKKRPVVIRSAALTAAISSAAKLRKTGVQINSPAPARSNAPATPSSVLRPSRFMSGLATTNIIAVPKLVTRKRANQPDFARTARLAARSEQQEAKNDDDDDTTPEPEPQPDTPSSSSIVVRGAKRMKIDTSTTPAGPSATDGAGSSSNRAGPFGATPRAARAVSTDGAGPSTTPRPAVGPSATSPRALRTRTAPKVGRFTNVGVAQPTTQPSTPAVDSEVTVTKAGEPMKARAHQPTRVQAAVTADDDRSTLPLAIVVTNDRNKLQAGHDRVKIVSEFVAEIPETCTEAIRAMKFGQQIRNRQYPGIPDKKFLRNNYAKYGSDESLIWPMQAAFEKKDHPKMWYVYFEGWTIPYSYEESHLKKSGEDTLEAGKIRRDFLNKIATMDVTKDRMEWVRYCEDKRKTDSLFWDYEDLSYFHTKIHFEDGLGPIFYMNLSKDCEKPPTYSYTTTNIMDEKVYNWCLKQKMNWSIEKLDSKKKLNLANVEKVTGCENPSGCVCNRRFAHLYEDVINLRTKDGLLQVTQSKRDSPRISIECSDACGCSNNCPRRHMQRGNQKALVVNFEGSRKGMGLRAGANYKKGEYIGEYTGILKEPVDGEDQSYEAAVSLMADQLVICSRKCGNIIRFMSHSCSPNAMFVVTWSRVKESDPLLPKIAVFATEDINMGEEITICYWTAEDRDAATEFVKCWCGTKDCIKDLPVIS